MIFPPHILDEIRARLSVSTVVGRRVTWDQRKSQPSRGDYWACCPFHNEKTPSFHCDDRRGHYHCFGCGVSGDIFRFLTEREGYSFPEAVEQLAAEAGVPLPKPDPQAEARAQKRAGLSELVEMAAQYYETNLRAPAGGPALAYARRRGFEERTLREFRFGFAPDQRDGLRRHLAEKGASDREMADAGLITLPDDGRSPYDRMRERLIIPICDRMGRVIAFGGRVISDEREPKYLNSPESSLFQKRSVLFNLHRAREPAHRSGQVVVVEGYLDAIAAHQAGVESVVAALGTAFTEDQIRALWQLADEPILCFDGDAAGKAAAYRAIDRMLPLLTAGKSFRFVFLADGRDPDDLIRSGGRSAFMAEMTAARPLHEILWERETANAQLGTPERRASLEQRIDQLVDSISDGRVAKGYRFNLRLKLADLFRELDKGAGRSAHAAAREAARRNQPVGIEAPRLAPQDDRLEQALMGLSVEAPQFFEAHLERVTGLTLSSDSLKRFCGALERALGDSGSLPPVEAFGADDPDFFATLHRVHGRSDEAAGGPTSLYELMPILASRPPGHVIEQLYTNLIDRLELRDMRIDYDREVAEIGDELTEEGEARLLAILRDIQRRGEELERREQGLAEALRAYRKTAEADLSGFPGAPSQKSVTNM